MINIIVIYLIIGMFLGFIISFLIIKNVNKTLRKSLEESREKLIQQNSKIVIYYLTIEKLKKEVENLKNMIEDEISRTTKSDISKDKTGNS